VISIGAAGLGLKGVWRAISLEGRRCLAVRGAEKEHQEDGVGCVF